MTIPAVDPRNPLRGPDWVTKPFIAFARSGVGRWAGVNVLAKVDPYLLRWSSGKVSIFAVYRHVELTTTGRKSGEPRTVPLLYFTEGDEVVLIASSFGRDKHPAWYHNITANPDVTLGAGGASHAYVAREVTGDERADLYAKAELLYPGYGDYRSKTEAIGRTIPVLALRPA